PCQANLKAEDDETRCGEPNITVTFCKEALRIRKHLRVCRTTSPKSFRTGLATLRAELCTSNARPGWAEISSKVPSPRFLCGCFCSRYAVRAHSDLLRHQG